MSRIELLSIVSAIIFAGVPSGGGVDGAVKMAGKLIEAAENYLLNRVPVDEADRIARRKP
jgi:hypothetical protein